MNKTRLARYDRMVAAIRECYEVDELMQIRDQAAALQAAARIAMNTDAEKKAIDIRLRAEFRAGELLAAMQRGEPGRPGKNAASVAGISEYRRAIEKAGID